MIDLSDLTKLPYLVQHYQQHKDKVEKFSFSDFINLHYGNEAERHDKEEHEKHKGLPFKTHDGACIHIVTILTKFNAPEIECVSSEVVTYNFYQSTFSSEFSQSIWQPPKNS